MYDTSEISPFLNCAEVLLKLKHCAFNFLCTLQVNAVVQFTEYCVRWHLLVGDVFRIIQGSCSVVSIHSFLYVYIYVYILYLYMRKWVMLPFSSNVNSIKLGKINFLKSCYDRFCMTVLNCALRMGYISIKKKNQTNQTKTTTEFSSEHYM